MRSTELQAPSWSALLLAAVPLRAQAPADAGAPFEPYDAIVERVIELGASDSRVQEHLEYLARSIGPRLTGSGNLTRACRWAEARFADLGLEARLEEWGTIEVGFDKLRERGAMVAPERMELAFETHAWTAGTPGPLRAPARLEPKTLEELETARGALAGAWIVKHGKRAPKEIREAVDAALAAAGIAGTVQSGGERIVTAGNHRLSWDELPARPSILLRKDQHELVVARLRSDEAVELEFDLDHRFVRGPLPLYNVVADLRGETAPDEYVVVGGHIDSWDAAEGAQDNGTGCATTLEAARLLAAAGARPARTIRFMLWSGEEQGLLGSEAWVGANAELLPRISAVLVHDGGTNYLAGLAGPRALVEDLRLATSPLAELDPAMPFRVRENEGLSAFGASDHAAFTQQGVPGFFWEQAGRADYDLVHHTQHDTFETAVPEYQRHSAVVAAVTAYNLARLDHLLDRTDLVRPRRPSTRRVMGVDLEGAEILSVSEGSLAEGAGWQEGDVILSIDGVPVADRGEIAGALQQGGPRKLIVLQRGAETIESTLDWTGTASEKAREEATAERAAEEPAPGAPERAPQSPR